MSAPLNQDRVTVAHIKISIFFTETLVSTHYQQKNHSSIQAQAWKFLDSEEWSCKGTYNGESTVVCMRLAPHFHHSWHSLTEERKCCRRLTSSAEACVLLPRKATAPRAHCATRCHSLTGLRSAVPRPTRRIFPLAPRHQTSLVLFLPTPPKINSTLAATMAARDAGGAGFYTSPQIRRAKS